MDSFVAAFASLAYERCDDGVLDSRFEKLALYADERGWPTHVARQLASGAWTSKLGPSEDIEHQTPGALEGVLYGKIVQFLRRRRT